MLIFARVLGKSSHEKMMFSKAFQSFAGFTLCVGKNNYFLFGKPTGSVLGIDLPLASDRNRHGIQGSVG